MKIRVIKKGDLYCPQQLKKGYYGNRWIGFGKPNIRFREGKLALDFAKLVDKSVPAFELNEICETIYQNFEEEDFKKKDFKV